MKLEKEYENPFEIQDENSMLYKGEQTLIEFIWDCLTMSAIELIDTRENKPPYHYTADELERKKRNYCLSEWSGSLRLVNIKYTYNKNG
jgi:hypothetical protein